MSSRYFFVSSGVLPRSFLSCPERRRGAAKSARSVIPLKILVMADRIKARQGSKAHPPRDGANNAGRPPVERPLENFALLLMIPTALVGATVYRVIVLKLASRHPWIPKLLTPGSYVILALRRWSCSC
jgi:hypothetical protein